MREFFRGWKRKIGVMALVLACFVAVGWVRSLRVGDWIRIPIGEHAHFVLFTHPGTFGGGLSDDPSAVARYRYDMSIWTGERYTFRTPSIADRVYDTVHLSYWSIVLPLTLISAWCLLTKPRAKRATTPEPAHA
jgi:hypothetical protein